MSVICCDDPRPHRHATSADIRIGDVLLPWYPDDPAGESTVVELYTERRQYSSVQVRVDQWGRRVETRVDKPAPVKVATDRQGWTGAPLAPALDQDPAARNAARLLREDPEHPRVTAARERVRARRADRGDGE